MPQWCTVVDHLHSIMRYSEWTEMFPHDFRDERMMRHFKEITQLCACQSGVG